MNEQINKQTKSNNPLEAAITPSTSVRGTWPLGKDHNAQLGQTQSYHT